ncbi:MAG: alpha-L-arabinofuranosidase C-terminal domain-containing protein [Candidatus Pseudobacter hemicellulosilyticus]|uniref:non-reducing end alpha-L-arabinofuranosidase n=1 Tax=Candidatus Pseudobacter hemicellulosilyticus TaxID=3121375 RepID=A0AAJ6BFE2_9BACT|nr:MAG: alpha-L-arabinofuranosidase C-terminal domain-containing protein [Pseudobacter sp.]
MFHPTRSVQLLALLFCSFLGSSAIAQKLVVKTKQPTAGISPTMWGVFFEDINFGADGGLYAELVKNRSFEFFKPLTGWKTVGKKLAEGDLLVLNRGEADAANPRFLRVQARQTVKNDLGLVNEGFRGMGIKAGLRYDFSVQYRLDGQPFRLLLELLDNAGAVIGNTSLPLDQADGQWHNQQISFTASATATKGSFRIWFEGNGKADFDMISLFPSDTWKQRPGGLRADMVQWLADLKPGFIRFPGGCIVEGPVLAQRYQWKNTVGALDQRPMVVNRWNFEFGHRPAPDYYQSFGLGFYEYFQLAEDIGAQPLPILNCGMACQYNSAELVSMDDLQPYIQDALDLVEFANGDTTSQWGRLRASMGHPAPFHLTMIGIGNENWGPQYIERLQRFTTAIKAQYPDIQIVNSAGTDPSGDRFQFLDSALRKMNADVIDEHYYRSPDWFLQNASRYDTYSRNGSMIFAGEYAAQTDRIASTENRNNWRGALAEAAFMTGLERNAGVVRMASYAPLFAHEEGWQWKPDLIWVNNLQSYGTPNYYAQQLFSLHKGTHVLPILLDNQPLAGQDSLYATAALDSVSKELIIKLVNAGSRTVTPTLSFEGMKKTIGQARQIILHSPDLAAENTFAAPLKVSPKEETVFIKGSTWPVKVEGYSVNVLRIKLR